MAQKLILTYFSFFCLCRLYFEICRRSWMWPAVAAVASLARANPSSSARHRPRYRDVTHRCPWALRRSTHRVTCPRVRFRSQAAGVRAAVQQAPSFAAPVAPVTSDAGRWPLFLLRAMAQIRQVAQTCPRSARHRSDCIWSNTTHRAHFDLGRAH